MRDVNPGPSRRSFLVGTGLVAGAAVLAGPGRQTAAAAAPETLTGGTPPIVYADQIHTVRPGEILSMAGSGLTSGVLIKLWLIPNDTSTPTSLVALPGTPPSGAVSLTAIATDGDNLVTEVPATTTDAAYAVYVSSDSGTTWSAPRLLNAAQPWYLDQPTAAPGDVVTVIGPSVAHSAPTTKTPQVYVRSAGGGLTSCVANVTSDYELAFTVPSTLALGNYSVLVSNGLGGHYGYDASLDLTVAATPVSPTTTYDVVTDFGADPSGAADSTTSIQNALDAAAAASGGARVLFPAGNYGISAKLTLGSGSGVIDIVGAGANTTKVLMSDGSTFSPTMPTETSIDLFGCTQGDDRGMLYLAPSTHPVALTGIGFGSNGKRPIILQVDGRTGTTVTDCTFVGDSYPTNIWLYAGVCSILVQNTRGLRVANCAFTCNKGMYLSNVVDTRIEDNTFAIFFPRLPTDPSTKGQADNDGVQVWGARRLTIRGNHFGRGSSTYHYARAVQTGAVKLWATTWGPTDACGMQDVLMAHNTVDSAGEPSKNNGEALVGDGIKPPAGGGAPTAVASATSDTVTPSGVTFTLNTLTDPVGSYVIVIAGTGTGQIRRVVGNTSTTLTVERAWEVVPDTSSVVVVQNVHARQLFVHNTITACSKYVGNYGPSVLSIVAANTIDSTGAPGTVSAMTGAGFFSIYGVTNGIANSQPSFYNLVADNELTGADAFVSYQNYGQGGVPPAPLLRGNVLARNTSSGIAQTVTLADSTLGGSPATTWGRYNAIVKNVLGSGVTYQASVDGRFDHTVYQGAAAELVNGGTNTVVVPG